MVSARSTQGEFDMSTSTPAAQQLRDILDRDSSQRFEGSGCSDHVRRRQLVISVAGAALLLVLLVALLLL